MQAVLIKTAIYSLALPALFTALISIAPHLFFSSSQRDRQWKWLVPCTLGISFIIGFLGHSGKFGFPPTRAMQWLPYVALAGVALGLLETSVAARLRLLPAVWAPRFLLAALMAWLLLPASAKREWTPLCEVAAIAITGLGVLLLITVSEDATAHAGSATGWLLLAVLTFAASISLLLSGSVLLGQLAGTLATALATCAAISFFLPHFLPGNASVLFCAFVLSALLLCGVFLSELPKAAVPFLILAPLASRVAGLLDLKSPFAKLSVRCGAVGASTLPALWLAGKSAPF